MTNRTKDLTPKQFHFCRAAVSGQTLSDSYRESYSAGNMSAASIHREASLLMSNPTITQRVQRLQKALDRATVASSLTDREKVLEKLRYFMNEATPQDSSKIRAAELLGKSIGLFTDVIESKGQPDLSPAELRATLEQKLTALLDKYQVSDATGIDTEKTGKATNH